MDYLALVDCISKELDEYKYSNSLRRAIWLSMWSKWNMDSTKMITNNKTKDPSAYVKIVIQYYLNRITTERILADWPKIEKKLTDYQKYDFYRDENGGYIDSRDYPQ